MLLLFVVVGGCVGMLLMVLGCLGSAEAATVKACYSRLARPEQDVAVGEGEGRREEGQVGPQVRLWD